MPSSSPEAAILDCEAKAAFHLRLRARGIRDLAVLRAMELVPRSAFVPHRYLDLAMRDLALPIGCGQTLNEPWLVARMIEALDVGREHRVLQIGAGSGYATAILAHLAREVMGLERYQSLALAAQGRLTELGCAGTAVVWGDGLDVPDGIGAFERIIVHGVLAEVPARLMDRLAADGVMIIARPAEHEQRIVRITEGRETPVCPCRLSAIVPGLAAL